MQNSNTTDISYTLQVNPAQAEVISNACELLARLHMGQFIDVAELFFGNISVEDVSLLREGLKKLEPLATQLLSGHHGIRSDKIPDSARIAFDLYQVVRHCLAWDKNPEGGFQVQFDEPWLTSRTCGLARIEGTNNERQETEDSE